MYYFIHSQEIWSKNIAVCNNSLFPPKIKKDKILYAVEFSEAVYSAILVQSISSLLETQ